MSRSTWGTVNSIILAGLIIVALTVWGPARLSPPASVPTQPPPSPQWEPITLGMAILLAGYSDREDWSGCEIRGTSPLYVRCPDGYTMEIK